MAPDFRPVEAAHISQAVHPESDMLPVFQDGADRDLVMQQALERCFPEALTVSPDDLAELLLLDEFAAACALAGRIRGDNTLPKRILLPSTLIERDTV